MGDPDRYSRAALEALRQAQWCKQHQTTRFLCDHRHEADTQAAR